ncbi:MAG TPA: exodeoxyribonuclease VII small subunit [Coriobacteriia bacterium]|nr:exodeoxyribonuclease VII small subunit [Coriobacteriia bacterium]
MADERYTFAQARTRLEEIVGQVRKKDVSLEASLDLLEEGVRLANICTELSDHSEWRTVAEEQRAAGVGTTGDTASPEE